MKLRVRVRVRVEIALLNALMAVRTRAFGRRLAILYSFYLLNLRILALFAPFRSVARIFRRFS